MTRSIFGMAIVLMTALACPVETHGSRPQPAGPAHHASLLAPVTATPPGNQCPYDFQSPMPWGVYCLYRGTLRGPANSTCRGDVGMIWSSYDPALDSALTIRDAAIGSVTLGLVGDPEIVFRATAGPGRVEAAELTTFSADEGSWRAVVGHVRLTLERQPGEEPLQVLSLHVNGQVLPLCDGRPFVSYEGEFVGVLSLPVE